MYPPQLFDDPAPTNFQITLPSRPMRIQRTTQDHSSRVENILELLETDTGIRMGNHALDQRHGPTSVKKNDSDAAQAHQV